MLRNTTWEYSRKIQGGNSIRWLLSKKDFVTLVVVNADCGNEACQCVNVGHVSV